MSFSFSSLIRLIALLLAGSTMFAVGISRVDRPRPESRTRQATRLIGINDYYTRDDHREPLWFDPDSGRLEPMSVIPGDVVEAVSQSPWVDARGNAQVVGRWSVRSSRGPTSTSADFGLARYTFPEGKLIDHTSSDVMPIAPPVWYPGTRARILFASGDGRLYHHAFESNQPGPGTSSRPAYASRPQPLVWGVNPPGVSEPYVSEVVWHDDHRLGGGFVVALRVREVIGDGQVGYTRSTLWWLKLDESGSTITEAAPLITNRCSNLDERSPALMTLPDGRLALAMLRHQTEERAWKACLGVVEVNPETGRPEVVDSSFTMLEPPVLPAGIGFSTDGRFLAVIRGDRAEQSAPGRLSTDAALFADPSATVGLRAEIHRP